MVVSIEVAGLHLESEEEEEAVVDSSILCQSTDSAIVDSAIKEETLTTGLVKTGIPHEESKRMDIRKKGDVETIYRKHYEANRNSVYDTFSKPKGLALILAVLNGREGAQAERNILVALFTYLGYNVKVRENPTAADIYDDVATFAEREDHREAGSAVLCILAHGSYDAVRGVDGLDVNIHKLMHNFDSASLALAGKPKLIVINACRKMKGKKGLKVPEREDNADPDVIMLFSTAPSHTSKRNTKYGSRFIQVVDEVFRENADHEDVESMCATIRQEMTRYTFENGFKQRPAVHSLLPKKWFFYPSSDTFKFDSMKPFFHYGKRLLRVEPGSEELESTCHEDEPFSPSVPDFNNNFILSVDISDRL